MRMSKVLRLPLRREAGEREGARRCSATRSVRLSDGKGEVVRVTSAGLAHLTRSLPLAPSPPADGRRG